MTTLSPHDTAFLWFAFFCLGIVLLTVAWIAADAIANRWHGVDDALPPPTRDCERQAAREWRTGASVTGWRRYG